MSHRDSLIRAEDFEALVRSTIPAAASVPFSVVEVSWGHGLLRLRADASMTRAGGTLSGPTLMTMADTALYLAVLSCIGLVPLAVTQDLHIRFLRRPKPIDLLAEARILRLGRRVAVGEVSLWSDGAEEDPVAHVTGSYALPRPH